MITGVCFMMYYFHGKLTKAVLKLLGIRSSINFKAAIGEVFIERSWRRLDKNLRMFSVGVFV